MPFKEIGHYKINYLQVLDENGKIDSKLDPKLTKSDLIYLYESMVLARIADDRTLKMQRQGRIGTVVLNSGQEAASVGPTFAMDETDWFVPAFRELGGMLMRGVPLENVFLTFAGYEEGNIAPEANRILPISIPIASQMLHAVGLAYALRQKGENVAVIVYFGDGATSEGDFHEALNFASVWQVPVVFICQNNHWAISVPREKQTHSKTIAQKAIAYDMPGIQVDGNDVLAMYRAAKEALNRAHNGDGPTLIEAVTYRLLMHSTSDDPTRYRTDEEVENWKLKDPILRMQKYLKSKKYLTAKMDKDIEEKARKKVDAAVKAFEARKDFKPDAPFDHVFETRYEILEDQRAEFLERLKRTEARNG